MENEKPKTIKYLLTTMQNGLGQFYFTAERVQPWYKRNTKLKSSRGSCEFYNRDAVMHAIRLHAENIREKPLRKYKIKVVEPIEA